ncbi:hypothetical protein FACS1894219_08340 [Clostridia bacterium]|nr:hypothetical protein FACS1894219_08340 [Clostridia bacterium]
MYTESIFPEMGVRFIAIGDNVDSENGSDNDFTPFKNVFNEWFCRDTSRKVRAIKRARALAGKHATSVAPYGYKPSETDKFVWTLDETVAENVREIFHMCMQGKGPFQIAKIFKERKVLIPRVYANRWTNYEPKYSPYNWCASIVSYILSNPEYTGDAVMSRYMKKSYKSRAIVIKPEEEWITIPNAHEPIIDREVWATVQRLREGRHKCTKMGDMGPLNGILFCDTCGKKLYLSRAEHRKNYQYFVCGTYRRFATCTNHNIRTDVAERLILEDIRRVVSMVDCNEKSFVEAVQRASKK